MFAVSLLVGLYQLHSNGIVYNDIKPSNFLLDEFGKLKFSDFGLAIKISTPLNEMNKKGTPSQMAPELFQEYGVCSYNSDFYSFGCIMFELATGHPPFQNDNLEVLLSSIQNDEPHMAPSFSKDFSDLLKKLLIKDPLKRIAWDKLIEHNFWKPHNLNKLINFKKLPINNTFDEWVNKYKKKASTREEIVRISMNVNRNILKEARDNNQ